MLATRSTERHGADGLVDLIVAHRQRRPEADRPLAAGQHDHVLALAQIGDHRHRARRGRQVEGHEQPATADVADQRRSRRRSASQAGQKSRALRPGGLDQALGLDDLQEPAGADHVDQTAAPGGVDPTGDGEHVVGHLVDPAAGHDAAELGLLGEGDDVGLDAQLLVGPRRAGGADPGLHLVEDEQRVVIMHELAASAAKNSGADVVVAALALDRLGDERRDVVRVVRERPLALVRSACSSAATISSR